MQNLLMNRFYKKSHVLEIVFIDLSKNNDSHILPCHKQWSPNCAEVVKLTDENLLQNFIRADFADISQYSKLAGIVPNPKLLTITWSLRREN